MSYTITTKKEELAWNWEKTMFAKETQKYYSGTKEEKHRKRERNESMWVNLF